MSFFESLIKYNDQPIGIPQTGNSKKYNNETEDGMGFGLVESRDILNTPRIYLYDTNGNKKNSGIDLNINDTTQQEEIKFYVKGNELLKIADATINSTIGGVNSFSASSSGLSSTLFISDNGFSHSGTPSVNNLTIKNAAAAATTGIYCRESTKNVGIVCNGINMINVLDTTGTTIATSTTTPKIILTQPVSNSDPQIQSSTDAAPKCGINISENNVSIVTEGNIAVTFANGQINFYKPCIMPYEVNPLVSRTGTITAINTDNKVQKLNFTSADCIYILPTGLNDGTRYELIPFKTGGAFACYVQVGTGVTISTIIGGVKTNYTTAGTNIALTEGYAYNCIYQSSITTWIVWRSG